MKVKWYGHAAVGITSNQGTRIIIDPYDPGAYGDQLRYGRITDPADIVITSHDHGDHNGARNIPGSPEIVKGTGVKKVKGITIKGIHSYHDGSNGKERGENTIFVLTVDDMNLCHLGDLGHLLSEKDVSDIGTVDILFIPVGGYFTIDAKQATRVAEQLKPKLIVPIHFKTDKCGFPISSVDEFIKGKTNVKMIASSEIELLKNSLPEKTEILVLRHAM